MEIKAFKGNDVNRAYCHLYMEAPGVLLRNYTNSLFRFISNNKVIGSKEVNNLMDQLLIIIN